LKFEELLFHGFKNLKFDEARFGKLGMEIKSTFAWLCIIGTHFRISTHEIVMKVLRDSQFTTAALLCSIFCKNEFILQQ
jgi:hypothetical protein